MAFWYFFIKKEVDKILILLGKSGSGKSTICKYLKKSGYKQVSKFTTRKKRDENDNEYNFVDDDAFNKFKEKGLLICTEEFTMADGNKVNYGYYKHDFERDTNKKFAIMTPESLLKLIELNICDNIIPYYLYCSEEEIYNRLLLRGDNKAEVKRRIDADNKDFENIYNIPNLNSINVSEIGGCLAKDFIIGNYLKQLKEREE